MATNKITYTLDFKANFKDVQGQLTNLKNSLNSVIGMQLNGGHLNSDIKAASNAAAQLKIHLRQALDPKTGKLDLSRLQNQMRITGISAKSLANDLLRGGHQGAQAYLQLSNAMLNAQKSGIRLNEIASQLWITLKNTAKWQVSSYALTSLTSALSDSLKFATDLDKSLNDIRIVTGASREEMERFAIAANTTAKALSTSTKKVADATLIYRQQGDTAEEAAKKAEITIKAANASRTEAQEMSEYLTGIWNSYQVGADSLELFADKLVKVGAVTATSSEELATSMTKVAATANTVGVTYDQLLSTIATVSSATRISAEQIGTAFKTIYARMGDLELKGSIDEDGVTTTLGTVSSSLKQVGVNVLDINGNIRDMGAVIEDLGGKWETMTLNQKTAIAEAVAGKRQYTQLFALFENWDEYQRTLKEAGDAQGELNKQQAIYMDSIEGAKARLKASKEEFLLGAMDNETIQESIDLLADFTKGFGNLVENAGGLVPIMTTIFGSLILKNAPAISASLTNMGVSFLSLFTNSNRQMVEFQANWNKTMDVAQNTAAFKDNPVLMAELTHLKERSELQLQYMQNQKNLNTVEKEQVKILIEQVEQERLRNIEQQERLKIQASNSIDRVFDDPFGKNRAKFESMTFDLTGMGLNEEFINSTNNLQVFGKEVDKTKASIYALAKAYTDLGDSDRAIIENVLTETGLFENLQGSIEELLSQYVSYEGAQSRTIEINNNSTVSIKEIIEGFSLQSKSLKEVEANMEALINKQRELQEINSTNLKKPLQFNQVTDINKTDWSSFTQIQDKMMSGKELNSEEIEKALSLLNKMTGTSENAAQKIERLKKAFLNLKEAKKPVNNIEEAIRKLRTEAEQLDTKISMVNIVNGFISASTAAMTLSSSLSMLGSSWQSMFGEDGEGITLTGVLSLVGSLGMLFTSLKSMGSGLKELNTVYEAYMKKKLLLDTADTLSETGNAEATKYNRKETKKFIQVIKEKIGWTNKETASTVTDTIAEGANGAASSGAGAKALAAIGGTVGLYVLGIAAAIAITVKWYKTCSTAAVKLKKYKETTEELNKVQEKTNKLNDEINSLEELSNRLEQAEGDKKALLEVSKDLNKEIGYIPGLVEGEAKAYEIASARLQKYIELKKQEAEREGRKAGTLGKAQYESITIEKSGFDIARTKDIQKVMQEVAKMSEEDLEEFKQGGKVQGMTYKDYTQALQKMQEAQEVAFKEVYENANLAVGGASTLRDFGEVLAASYVDTKITEQFFKDIQDKDLQEIVNEYLETGDSGKLNKVFKDLEKEYGVIPGMTEELREYKDFIYSMQNDELDAVKNFSTASLDTTKSFNNLNKVLKSSSALIQDYTKDGKLSWDNISTFVKDLKENYGIQDAELEQIQVKLINNDLQGGINQAIQLVIGNLKTDLDSGKKDYATAVSSATAMLSASGISNAKEMATYLLRSAGAEAALAKNTATTIQLLGDKKSELKEIANTYGLIEAEMYSILLNEKIFASGNKNKEADIVAWATQVGNNSDIVLSDDQKKYLDFIIEQAKGGTLEGLDEAIRLLDKQIVVNNLKSKDSTLYAKIEEDRIEAEKEYKRSIDKWIKDDALAKVEDRIEEFTNTLEKESRKIKSIDWLEDNFGITNYEEKVSSLTESVKISLQELDELSQVEIIGADQAEAIENELSTSYDNFHNYIEQLLEATDELSTEEAEQLTEVITKQYELISATLDGMNKILEINARQEGMFSQEKEKNALLKVFGNTLGSISEEEQKRNKRLRLEEKLQIDILEIEKRYQKEINKAALISTKKGVEERQKEREYEKEQIEKAYREAMANCKLALKSLSDLTKTETDKMVNAFTNAINAAKGFKDEINSIQFPSTMGLNPEEVAKGKISNFDAYTVKTKGGTGEYRNDLVYESKSGEALGVYAPKGLTGTVVGTGKSEHNYWVKIQDETGNITTVARMDELDSSIKKGTEITSGTSLGKSKSWRVRDTIHHDTDRTWSEERLKGLGAYSEEPYEFKDVLGNKNIVNVSKPEGIYFIGNEADAGTTGIKAPKAGTVEKIGDWYYFKTEDLSNGFRFRVTLNEENVNDIPVGIVQPYQQLISNKEKNKGDVYFDIDQWQPRVDGYAKGSDSTPAGEAFVGEEGRELILLPDGKIVLAGQDGMELANLPQGARVLTNEETEEILRNKKDYANLILSQTSKSGQKIAFNRFAEGTNSLQNEDFLSDTSKLQEEFYKSELNRQQEQNSAIKTSLENKNKQVEKETDKHYKSLENKTKEMSSSIQKIMGKTNVKLPEIESEDFINSLEKTITKAYLMIYGGGEWLTPVQGAITSKFGKRNTGIEGASTNHQGIDIGAASGLPILATKDGKVVVSSFNKESGNYIRIDHGNGYVSAYAHMKEPSSLKVGDKVSQGDVIGYVGDTGISRGAHLHFAVYKDGKAIDPEKLITHARGGVTKQGKALVGEYGREIILYPDGTAGILGANGMEFADLPAGAQIIPNEETEKILNNPVDYKISSFANGTYGYNKEEMEKLLENIKTSVIGNSNAKLIEEALYQITNFNNLSSAERIEFLNKQSSIATANALEIKELTEKQLIAWYNDYNSWKHSTGQEDKVFEAFMGEMFITRVEDSEKIFDEAEEKIEQQREVFLSNLEFDKNVRTITGSWTEEDDFRNSLKSLHNTLELFPKDMNRISESWDEFFSAAKAYMDAYLAEFNRQYEKKIELEEYEITRLESLKTLQENINTETNSYREVMHEINKELNSSRISTKWLDKTQKEYLFNEKDYLAVSKKVAEVRSAALQDWENTQEAINNLSNDELYRAKYLNEAYQERADIREKELTVLREELNLQKKQMALNEALMERNVRVFSGGRWRQIANVENVRKAQEDLDETRYQIQTQQLELNQQREINTIYNTKLRESNELIDKWNKTMELAAKEVEEAFRELTGTVDVNNLSLSSFKDEVIKVVTAIQNERNRLEQLGIQNGVSKEDFNNNYSGNSGKTIYTLNGVEHTYATQILEAKQMYDEATTDYDRQVAHNYAESMRAQAMAEGGVAAEIAVKSKNWSASEMNKYLNKNAAGTRDSIPGLSLVNEKGVEMLSTKYGQIIELNPHQKIFNNDQMNFLYDLSREGIQGMNRTVSAISTIADNSMSIETVQVTLPNVTDARSFAEDIKNLTSYIRNTKTIQDRNSR